MMGRFFVILKALHCNTVLVLALCLVSATGAFAVAPAAPTGLIATAGSAQVALTWTASTGATSYDLYRATTSGGEAATAYKTGITATSYTNTGLTNGDTYYYTVSALDSGGTSAQSAEATATLTPNAPTGLAAASTTTQVSLTWTATTGATSYDVFQGTASGAESSTPIATGVTAASYANTGLVAGTTYYYEIAAVNAGGTSADSAELDGTTLTTAPTGLAAVSKALKVTLTWTATPGATKYAVYSGTTSGGESATALTTGETALTYANTNLTAGITYYYTIAAEDAGGTSAMSAEVNATTEPAAPPSLSATGGTTQVILTWATTPFATSYAVFRGTATGGEKSGALVKGLTTTTYTNTGLVAGTTYYYKVAGADSAGTGVHSAEAAAITIPATPAGLTATGGAGQVSLAWTADTGATGYAVYRGTSSGGENATPVGTSTTTSYTDTGLAAGTTYYYKVASVDASGTSAESTEANATTASAPPMGVTATGGTTQVAVSWTASSGAASYNLYRGTASGGEGSTALFTGITATSYTNTGLSSGTTYYYTVAAINASGTSSQSGEASAITISVAPANLQAGPGNTTITLTWEASAGAATYNVYRGSAAGAENATPVATGVTGMSYTETGLTNATIYYFKAAAVNASGTSPLSTEAFADPEAGIASPPTGLTAAGGTAQVALSWAASGSATSYNVYSGTTSGGESSTPITTGLTTTSYTNTGLSAGTTYYYTLKAVNSLGTSASSMEASATTTPGAPAGLAAAGGAALVTVTWTATLGATSYSIYRGTATGGEAATAVATGVTTASYTNTGLSVGTTYYFKVAAVNAAGTSAQSSETSAVTISGAPTGLSGTGSATTKIALTWTATAGAATYNLYRGSASGAEGATAVETGITTASYTDSSLTAGTTYFYTVAAVNASGTSGPSSEASAITLSAAPTGLIAGAASTQVDLYWSTTTGAASYSVYRGTTSGGESATAVATGITATLFANTGLSNGTTYYYKVAAVNASGTSAKSSEVSAEPSTSLPSIPTGLTGRGSNSSVILTWTSSSGATSYNIYNGTTSGGESTTAVATGVTGTTYTNSGLANETTYYFTIAAVNASGTSPQSAEASALTLPGGPAGLTATAGNVQVGLSWTPDTGATSYNVYRGTTSGGESATPIATGGTSTTYLDDLVVNGVTYYYTVTGVNAQGSSVASNEASATPVDLEINSGGGASGAWIADTDYVGGTTDSVSATINTAQVANPAPQVVYQNYHYGDFIYTIPGLTAGASYNVNLEFAELVWTAPEDREFDVWINGTEDLSFFDVYATSGGSDIAIVEPFSTVANSSGQIVLQFVSEVDEAEINAIDIVPAPTVVDAASASPNPVTGTTTTLSVLGTDQAGASNLTYSWSVTGPGTVTVSNNNNNAASTVTATFTQAGAYTFTATLTDPDGQTATSSVNVTVAQTVTGMAVTPSTSSIAVNTTEQMSAAATDQFGNSIAAPSITWSSAGVGSINASGLFSAGSMAGTATVTASSGSVNAYATVTVLLAAPTGLTATGGSGQISLSWIGSSGATSYSIFRGTSSGGEGSTAIAGVSGTSYTNSGLSAGTTYYYAVEAVNASSTSAPSGEASATVLAGPPTSLTATAGNAQVALSWTAGGGATSYNVYRGTASGGESSTAIGASSGTAYTDTGLTNGVAYYYKVAGVDAGGISAQSTEASATPEPPVPSAPTGLTAAGGNTQVTLLWTASSGATTYNLYRGTASGAESGTALAITAGTSYTDTGLTNGVAYFYKVAAVNGGGISAESTEALATPEPPAPSAPTGLSATAGNAQVGLSWSASSGATSYNITRGTATGAESSTATGTTTGTSYTDTGLTNGVTCFYKVAAVNGGGSSPASSEASATPEPPAPSAPTGLSATAGNAQVGLSWSASSGATSYNITRGTASGAEGSTAIATASGTSYSDTGLTNGVTYFYKVAAVNGGGTSPASSEASATPEPPIASAPTGLSATPGNGQVSLTWTVSSGATSYNVFRSTTSGGEGSTAYKTGITTASYTDSGVTNGLTYYYTVAAINGGGTSAQSSETSATLVPAVPTGLGATAGNAQVSLSWSATLGATSYNIYRATTSGGEGSTAYKTGITTVSYTDSGVTNGLTYYYTVAAINGGGTSAQSSEASATLVPAVPTGLGATVGNAQVSLSWTPGTGATSYSVYRGTTSGGEGASAIATSTSATYIDTAVTSGMTYYYKVAAVNGGGTSALSNEAGATLVPSVPTGLVATAANTQVSLTWTPGTGSTSYNIYRGTVSGGEGSTAIVTTTTAGYADTGLTNGVTYYFTIAAANGGGTSAQSAEVTATPEPPAPSAPTGLTATAGNGQVSLSWTASTGATTYNVYRGTTSGGEGSTAIVATSATSYTDYSLTNGTTYFFTVAAVNAGGTSAKSTETSACPEPPTPAAPTGLSATAGALQVSLIWTASTQATSYNVYRGTAAGGEGSTPAGTTVGTAYTDTGLAAGSTYYYKVAAVDGGGTSALSNEASATPKPPVPTAPAAPTGLTASAGSGQVSLSWTPSNGATSYCVYRGTSAGGEATTPIGIAVTSDYTDASVTIGLTYFYTVAAVNAIGVSAQSNEASASLTPSAPKDLVAEAGDAQVSLSWSGSAGATSYNVYMGTASGAEGASPVEDGIPGTSTVVTNLGGNTYYFTVTAVNAVGTSAPSNEASVTPAVDTPVSWGYNEYGSLGNATLQNSDVPVQVQNLTNVSEIAGGAYHSLALQPGGVVWAWGENSTGQLGNGSTSNSDVSVQVSQSTGLTNATSIAAGGYHSLAIQQGGAVWAWGDNFWGELGNNSTTNSSVPVPVTGLTGITAIAGGGYHSLALQSDGSVWAWGFNAYGQVGLPALSPIESTVPVEIAGLTGITAIAGGGDHSLALRADGTVWAWGYNNDGQLGNGTTNSAYIPAAVSGLAGVNAIAAGAAHSLALRSDGTVWAWGDNEYGQLGNGAMSNSPVPVQVTGLTGVFAISAGEYHNLALCIDGTVWAWGSGVDGQLGDGAMINSDTPVQVSGLSSISAISAGGYHSLALVTGVAPSVVSPATADPANVTGTTASLSVLGADSAYPASALMYTWGETAGPATVLFSANGSNAAQNTTATFSKPGDYTLTATITAPSGLSWTSSVSVTVVSTVTRITVSMTPPGSTMMPGQVKVLTALVSDQFGNHLSSVPGWKILPIPVGTLTVSGSIAEYRAAPAPLGTYTIEAYLGAVDGQATVTVE
ncbi:MAG: fibronectin type III domain-containing protein [Capsulimonadaceae bacterium]